jgi:DNA gyrase subunit A
VARKTAPAAEPVQEHIVDIDVASEMQGSFLEYAYSVIYSRALPDARDGLKPVQRRILYTMSEMGLRPDRGHVKSARVVGEVMGRLHPHGDSAIYDAMVRMAQSFQVRLPLIDGHGNFGSLDDGPAAYRYTEARLAPSAVAMTASLDEDVVDFGSNYDGRETEPQVLPSAIPALLVNGASGIAVGMATNMAPHNLGEVVAAAKYLLKHPKAGVSDLMKYIPGPDLPTGGIIVGLAGIADAYRDGRGTFKMRATVKVENVTARRTALVVTELPYNVGPERVIEKIKEGVNSKKITGISDVTDLSDGEKGLQLVIELKSGFNPQAVLTQLYKTTPLEEQFSINNVALVQGAPQTLGLVEMLEVFLGHRIEVVRRRSEFRRKKALERLHLVEGLLIAIVDIDKVISVIRASDDTAEARAQLMKQFKLSEIQTNYILEMPLRRLTKFSRIEIEKEQKELKDAISLLNQLLESENAIKSVVSDELSDVAREFGTPRRTVLQEDDGSSAVALDLEISDDPTLVMMSASGLIGRFEPKTTANRGNRAKNDTVVSQVPATARGEVGLITSAGKMHQISVMEIPVLQGGSSTTLKGGSAVKDFAILDKGEIPLGLVPLNKPVTIALGTATGVVKRIELEPAKTKSSEIIKLESGDDVVGFGITTKKFDTLIFITSDAQLLHYKADLVRPQGKTAAGMAGIKVSDGAWVISFSVVSKDTQVVTVGGNSDALPGTQARTIKISELAEFPSKGRATGGVRCHMLKRGEDQLIFAGAASGPVRASNGSNPIELPDFLAKRDASGSATEVAPTHLVGDAAI